MKSTHVLGPTLSCVAVGLLGLAISAQGGFADDMPTEEDYYTITETLWKMFKGIYGGGP